MNREPEYLKKVASRTPFRVPDGYFDGLTRQVMDALPPRPETVNDALPEPEATRWQKVRPLLYLAAMMIGAALIIRIAARPAVPGSNDDTALPLDEADAEMQYIATAIDNSMMDDYSLYVYLNEYEE